MEVREALRLLGGHADAADLVARVGRSAVRTALRHGDVVRLTRGRYALPQLPPSRLTALRARGVVSHVSAAQLHGWRTLAPPDAVHVSVACGAKPQPADGVRYHYRTLHPDDVEEGVTSPLRTVLDCAAVLPFREALAVADWAVKVGAVLPDELRAGAAILRGPFTANPRRVAMLADGRADNPFESALRAGLLDAGLLGFVPQVVVRCPGSPRVDLGDEQLRIAVEGDSYTYHGTRGAFAADCRRYDELVRAGWTVLRFAYEQVVFDPGWMVEVVRDVVRQRRRAA